MKKLIIMLLIVLSIGTTVLAAGDKGINTVKMQGYQALKVFAEFRDNEIVTSDFMQYDTQHFIIKYRPEDENIVRDTASMFEKSYKESEKEFGYAPKDKTVIIIYSSEQELWRYQKSVQGQAVMGLYSMGTIHILSPNAYKNQGESKMKFFESNGPVLHEYTHRVVDDLTGGNVELWLTEGLALYEEYNINGTEWAPGFKYKRYFNSQEMRAGFMDIEEVQAYKQSLDMVRYLVDKYGMNRMKSLMQELKSGSDLNAAFTKIYGITADQFIDSKVYAHKKNV